MRYIFYGAGSIGGVMAARLLQHGREVVLIARGRHLDALREHGLTLRTPADSVHVEVEVVDHPREIAFADGDIVVLTMKTQDTVDALDELRAAAGDGIPVICAQNGVVNERQALRRFARVYSMIIRFPGALLEPGVVANYDRKGAGEIELGRHPAGVDALVEEMAADLTACGFDGQAEPQMARWKYQKLIVNLGSAFAGVFGLGAETTEIRAALEAEAVACYAAAGIDAATREEAEPIGRQRGFEFAEIEGEAPFASSLWQGIQRGLRSAETDYLNGEIALMGALHGVPTPYNRALGVLANRCAREGLTPGTVTVEDFYRLVGEGSPQ